MLADGGSAAATRLRSWVILARAAGVPPNFDAVSASDPEPSVCSRDSRLGQCVPEFERGHLLELKHNWRDCHEI